jgi:serine/threonine-protein kinase
MRASGREPSAEGEASPKGLLPNTEGPAAFGKYHLFATLGRGGTADVYLAVSRGPMGFSKLVVVKRLRDTLAAEASFLDMFLDEARLAARLNHPNVVHTYEVGEQDGHYFIAMEYLDGQSLQSVLRVLAKNKNGSDLGPTACARIVADALAGLHYAHELKDYDGTPLDIIHRDVSPHNVFVTYDGQVKLVDFGIAKAALSRTQTEVGVLKGKVAYMAPEQAMAGAIDRRADLFAMGIVLWELLTRNRLMCGESAAATLHRLLNKPVPRVSDVLPSIDRTLDAIVARALEKDPDSRFATAQEMRDALEAWIASSGAPVRQEEIGAKLSGLFASTRADVKRQIQEHMGLVERASNPGLPPGEPEPLVAQVGSKKSGALPLVLTLAGTALAVVAAIAVALWGRSATPAASQAPASATTVSPEAPASTAASATTTAAPTDTAPPPASATTEATGTTVASATKRAAWQPLGRNIPHATTTSGTNAPPAATAAHEPPGFLTLDTVPWTRVSEGARPLGTTPILGVPLSPGAHTLTLENPGEGIRTSLSVSIKSGERTSRRMMLRQP